MFDTSAGSDRSSGLSTKPEGTNPNVSLQGISRGISSKSLEQLLHLSELDYKIDAAAQYLQPIRTENDL